MTSRQAASNARFALAINESGALLLIIGFVLTMQLNTTPRIVVYDPFLFTVNLSDGNWREGSAVKTQVVSTIGMYRSQRLANPRA
jgi:hypothetical protein